MGRLERNAAQVARYVQFVWPKLERRGGVSDLPPMDRKAKGESHPPVGDHALEVMGENYGPPGSKKRSVFQALRAELDAIETGGNNRKSEDGVPFRQVLQAVRYDPGVVRQWRKGETEGQIEGAAAFWDVCRYVALILMMHFDDEEGPLELEVVVNPEDEEADDPRHAQRIDTHYTRMLMVEQLEEVERETGYKGQMAMEILGERKARQAMEEGRSDPNWTVPRLRKAREVINRERRKDRGEVA